MRNGTPKNLKQAIENGLSACHERAGGTLHYPISLHADIEKHVLDFLRQKFSVAYLDMGTFQKFAASEHGYGNSRPMTILEHLATSLGVVRETEDLTKKTGDL